MENRNSYEDTIRSNESIRDAMDGKLDEPKITESREEDNFYSCSCGKNENNKCDNCCIRS